MTANSMRGRWIAGLLWLTVAWPVCGESVVFWVTPTNLDGGGQFVFAVTNSPGSDGLSFHVTITPKRGEVPANSEAHLCSARIERTSRSIGPLTPETRVALKRSRHTWEAEFVASKELVSQPDTCFVFTAWDPRGPAADFYELRLRDFIALASAAASDFIIKQKDLTGPTGRPQRFSLSVHKMARLHLGGEPNRVLELSVADAAAEANSVKLWAAGVYENDAFPPTRWIADIADTEDQSQKLVLVVQAKTCFASLEIYQVDMSRPGLTNQSADELLKDNPAPIAALKFQYSNTLRELISADLSPKGRRVEIDGVSQQVGGVRTGPREPFMLTFNRQTGHWDIPADFAEKIKLTSRVPPSPYSSAVAEDLRVKLQSGGPEQKERALEAIMALGAVRLLPEAIGAIEDPTPLPRHGDTGWGFVGHEAATVVASIAQAFDGVEVRERGYRAYSFWDDSGDGGAKLKASGRLAEVRRNWERWWEHRLTRAGVGADEPLTKQIAAALKGCQTIKPGMTRAELSKVFAMEGGLSSAGHRTFVYRVCPYIKVDVDFTLTAAGHDGERPTDTITKISKPYLDWSVMD